VRGAPPSLTLESCFADSRQDYIVKLIEDAEAAQLRCQSPKQFRLDHNEQRYHEPECQSHDCAGSYSAPKYLLFAGRHFNLPKAWESLPHSRSTVTVQTIISPVSYKAALLKSNGQKFKLRHYRRFRFLSGRSHQVRLRRSVQPDLIGATSHECCDSSVLDVSLSPAHKQRRVR